MDRIASMPASQTRSEGYPIGEGGSGGMGAISQPANLSEPGPGQSRRFGEVCDMSASLIGHSGSSAFRLSTTSVSMSLTGSCFSSESAPGGPSIMGFEDEAEQSLPRPCREIRPTQADMRTHLIHRPARDIIPPLGGSQVFLLSDLILDVLTLRRPP